MKIQPRELCSLSNAFTKPFCLVSLDQYYEPRPSSTARRRPQDTYSTPNTKSKAVYLKFNSNIYVQEAVPMTAVLQGHFLSNYKELTSPKQSPSINEQRQIMSVLAAIQKIRTTVDSMNSIKQFPPPSLSSATAPPGISTSSSGPFLLRHSRSQ